MTTQNQTTDHDTWINIVDTLSLVNGTVYTLQNVSSDVVMLSEKSTIPVDGSPFHKVYAGQYQSITPESGLGLWIKGTQSGIIVAITET